MFGAQNPNGLNRKRTEAEMIWESISQIEQNLQQVVNHVNDWVAKIQGIDAVAFAALQLHGGKEFLLDKESVAQNQAAIQAVMVEMGRYRDEAQKEAEAAAAAAQAEAPAQPPVRLVTPRRPKNGALFVPKKEKKADGANGPVNPAKG